MQTPPPLAGLTAAACAQHGATLRGNHALPSHLACVGRRALGEPKLAVYGTSHKRNESLLRLINRGDLLLVSALTAQVSAWSRVGAAYAFNYRFISVFAAPKAGCRVRSLPFVALGLLLCGWAELVGKRSPVPHLSQRLQKYGELQRRATEMSCLLQALCELPGGFCCAYMLCVIYMIYTCLRGGTF